MAVKSTVEAKAALEDVGLDDSGELLSALPDTITESGAVVGLELIRLPAVPAVSTVEESSESFSRFGNGPESTTHVGVSNLACDEEGIRPWTYTCRSHRPF